MRESTYRLLTANGDVVSEVTAETLNDAAIYAENMGYDVLDTSDPDVVVVKEDHEPPALVVTVNASGECQITGTIPVPEAVALLTQIAASLATGSN